MRLAARKSGDSRSRISFCAGHVARSLSSGIAAARHSRPSESGPHPFKNNNLPGAGGGSIQRVAQGNGQLDPRLFARLSSSCPGTRPQTLGRQAFPLGHRPAGARNRSMPRRSRTVVRRRARAGAHRDHTGARGTRHRDRRDRWLQHGFICGGRMGIWIRWDRDGEVGARSREALGTLRADRSIYFAAPGFSSRRES